MDWNGTHPIDSDRSASVNVHRKIYLRVRMNICAHVQASIQECNMTKLKMLIAAAVPPE